MTFIKTISSGMKSRATTSLLLPYQRYLDTPGMQEATKKYASTVKTNAEGVIVNYAEGGGRPFPVPKTGLEMMYNFDYNNRGDARSYTRIGPVVETKARRERVSRAVSG